LKGIFVRKGVFAPRWLIPVLPVLAALGPYALSLTIAGINLFAFRMLILIMAAFSTPLTSGSSWWFNKLPRRAMLLGVLWLTCGMLSLLWTPSLSDGMADIVSIGFGFALLLVLFTLRAYESQNLHLLRIGWVAAFLVTAAVAVWEITTGQHLPSNMYEEGDPYFEGMVAQSTLGRPEQYGQFLLLATPFLLWSFYDATGPRKLAYASLVAAAGVLVLSSASRLSFIGFAAELLFLLFILDRRWYVMVLGLAGFAVGYVWFTSAFLSSDLRIAAKFKYALSDVEDKSIEGRIGLTLNGIWMVYDTAGRGIGAGGYREASRNPHLPFGSSHKPEGTYAHNLWVQIASEYGILPAIAFVALMLFIARIGLEAANRKWPGAPREVHVLGIVSLVGLVGYLIYGVVTGSAMRHSVQWMFFSCLVVIAAHLYNARAASYATRIPDSRERPLGPGALASSGRRFGKIGRQGALHRGSP
jgi:hypothetical protein